MWTQQGSKLVGTGVSVGDAQQGYSVALSGDGNTAIIGGLGDNIDSGAAWVFTRSGGVWTQQGHKLVGTGATEEARQGCSVALSGDGNTAIVGGPGDNSGAGAVWPFVAGPTLPPIPAITSVLNAASFAGSTVSPGSWVSIFGTSLAPAGDSRTWNPTTEM